jgi:ABC-2 type transport system permease protein
LRLLFALIAKEWWLLWRDKLGLAVLFLMPMFFVFTITLLQAHRPGDTQRLPVLLINYDQSQSNESIAKALKHNSHFKITSLKPDNTTLNNAEKQVSKGVYNALIIIPKKASDNIAQSAKQTAASQLSTKPQTHVQLILDPTLPPLLKQIMTQQLNNALLQFQMQAMTGVVSEVLGTSSADKTLSSTPILVRYAGNQTLMPNAVQQNIPAWALFGMFFIAIPLAGIMIKERALGVLTRFYIAPIHRSFLIIGRLIAFMVINFLQLWLMLLVGLIVMPWLGLPALNLSGHITALCLMGLVSAAAATTFGLLVGTYAKTIEQAASFAPIIIVISAAIGGIMMPLYLMPESLQHLANFSPLHWAHVGFINLLVRHEGVTAIIWPMVKLLVFSVVMLLLVMMRKPRIP